MATGCSCCGSAGRAIDAIVAGEHAAAVGVDGRVEVVSTATLCSVAEPERGVTMLCRDESGAGGAARPRVTAFKRREGVHFEVSDEGARGARPAAQAGSLDSPRRSAGLLPSRDLEGLGEAAGMHRARGRCSSSGDLTSPPSVRGAVASARDGDVLCYAAEGMYRVLNLRTGVASDLLPYDGEQSKPLVGRVGNNEFVVAVWTAGSTTGVFVSGDGHPAKRPPIEWPFPPTAFVVQQPYLVALGAEQGPLPAPPPAIFLACSPPLRCHPQGWYRCIRCWTSRTSRCSPSLGPSC